MICEEMSKDLYVTILSQSNGSQCDGKDTQSAPSAPKAARYNTRNQNRMTQLSSYFLAASFTALPLSAQITTPASIAALTAPAPTPKTLGESLENLGLLYKNKENPILNELWVLGRYHGHYHNTDGSKGTDEGWEDRRVRLGFQAKFFNKLSLHAQSISGSDFEPNYNGFSELWARWHFHESINLTLGQQKHRFTHERNISSRYMNYSERGMFVNMMRLDYTPAVTLSGVVGKWDYYTGVFSNATGTNMMDAFTELDSGYSFIAAAYYDLGTFLGADQANFYGSFINSDANRAATNLTRFDDGLSGALMLTKGSVSLVTELTTGFGGKRGEATGLSIEPGIYLTDNLQVVARYQLAAASQAKGLESQRRYESKAGLPSGDLYQAGYLGFNYYIADHRAKLVTGIEYARMNDEHTQMLFAGMRMFFGPHSNAPFPGNKMLDGLW